MTPVQLGERLKELSPVPLDVRLLKGKSTYISAKKDRRGVLNLSIHPLFLHAPTPVLQALVHFAMKPDSQSRKVIRQMAYLYFTKIAPPKADLALSDPVGEHVDLQILYDKVNRKYFQGTLELPISWFAVPKYKKFTHITFGSFDREQPLVRINRLLDHPSIPIEFVEFVVYHEMLHAVCLPEIDKRGHVKVHTREFKRREALHEHWFFAQMWEKKSLRWFRLQWEKQRGFHGRT